MISKENKRTIITLPKELRIWLEEQAIKENRSLSNYISTVLQKHKEEIESI